MTSQYIVNRVATHGPGGEGFVHCSYATACDTIKEALIRVGFFIGKHK